MKYATYFSHIKLHLILEVACFTPITSPVTKPHLYETASILFFLTKASATPVCVMSEERQ